MPKMTSTKWLIIGTVLSFPPIILEAITDVGAYINTNYYSNITDLSVNDPGSNIAFRGTIVLVLLGSIAVSLGLTYDWRKKTKSYVYKGSALLFLTAFFAAAFMLFWYLFFISHSGGIGN